MRKIADIIDMILNPIILWSYGWKRKKMCEEYILWQDPKNKAWLFQDDAIKTCEKRCQKTD